MTPTDRSRHGLPVATSPELDPFVLLRLPIAAWNLWRRFVPARYLVGGMALSTLGVLIYGCTEVA